MTPRHCCQHVGQEKSRQGAHLPQKQGRPGSGAWVTILPSKLIKTNATDMTRVPVPFTLNTCNSSLVPFLPWVSDRIWLDDW